MRAFNYQIWVYLHFVGSLRNKTKIGLVTSVILIVVLAAANVWVYTIQHNEIDSLRNELSDLRSYVSTHNYNNSEYNDLVNQKMKLEVGTGEWLTFVTDAKTQGLYWVILHISAGSILTSSFTLKHLLELWRDGLTDLE